jgi:hypothetical protein
MMSHALKSERWVLQGIDWSRFLPSGSMHAIEEDQQGTNKQINEDNTRGCQCSKALKQREAIRINKM